MPRVIRPNATVLGDSALVPPRNLLQPPPNQFTHELKREQPYYYVHDPAQADAPDGTLPAGTKVLLVRREDDTGMCQVADSQGLYVAIPFEGLRPLP